MPRRTWALCSAALVLLLALDLTDAASLSERAEKAKQVTGGKGPRGDATCVEGKCRKYARAELRACTGLCREYYPQLRKFVKDLLPQYPAVVEVPDGTGGLSPTLFFFNAAGVEIEKLEINGMFDFEIVEELEKRGLYPKGGKIA